MNVIAVGAHPDDVEIGAGGAIAHHSARGDTIRILIATRGGELSEPEVREREARTAADILGVDDVRFLDFEDTKVPYDDTIVKRIDAHVEDLDADRVYVHTEKDTHQDHKKTAQASVAATRNCSSVLAFESPSTRSSFAPEYYIPLSDKLLQRKIEAIKAHESQREKKYLEAEAMQGLARFRGRQANVTYAEAFQVVRIRQDLTNELQADR